MIVVREVKRLNLSFNLEREKDRRAYNTLKDKTHKTGYVIKALLAFEKAEKNDDEILILKQAMREVLKEINFTLEKSDSATQEKENLIPAEVFEIFEDI